MPNSEALQPTLHDTYQALLGYEALGKQAPNETPTLAWLLGIDPIDLGHREDDAAKLLAGVQGTPDLYLVYAHTRSLALLGAEPHEPEAIQTFLQSKRQTNGSYAGGPEDPTDPDYTTAWAVELLTFLGDSTGMKETRDWLLAQWSAAGSEPDAVTFATKVVQIGNSLERLGVDLADLPHRDGYAERIVDAIEEPPGTAVILDTIEFLSAAAEFLDIDLKSFASDFVSYVSSARLPGGGYTSIGQEAADMNGIALAVGTLERTDPAQPDNRIRSEMLEWLNQHATADGGFRPPITNRADPVSTVFALRILKYIGSEMANDAESTAYVKRELGTSRDLSVAFHAAAILPSSGLDDMTRRNLAQPADLILDALTTTEDGTFPGITLEDVYLALSLKDQLGEVVSSEIQSQAGELANRFLTDIARCDAGFEFLVPIYGALGILDLIQAGLGDPPCMEQLIKSLQDLQDDSGAFVEGRPALSSTYFGTASLAFLGEDSASDPGLQDWLASQEDPVGGYRIAPSVSGLPEVDADLTSTWIGLELRALLQGG